MVLLAKWGEQFLKQPSLQDFIQFLCHLVVQKIRGKLYKLELCYADSPLTTGVPDTDGIQSKSNGHFDSWKLSRRYEGMKKKKTTKERKYEKQDEKMMVLRVDDEEKFPVTLQLMPDGRGRQTREKKMSGGGLVFCLEV
ncbi:hypothetical protein ACH5RR_032012 [Cinchona calisaya]|uniref:Uncharacterized protein n=1 Tax=Cinchona calisaya TaxID=153742 RepID=A0ABD2YGX1_9GENT